MNPFLVFKTVLNLYVDDNMLFHLSSRWNEKHRYYHNIDHLVQILQDIERDARFKSLNVYEKHALLLAAFFHDSVYNPRRDDNEDQSISLFKHCFSSDDKKMFDKVCDLIEVTKHRKHPIKRLEKIFWDADNAGFKKGYNQLVTNDKLIQKEHSHVPKNKFKEKRIAFLESNIGLFGSKADKDIKRLINYYQVKF